MPLLPRYPTYRLGTVGTGRYLQYLPIGTYFLRTVPIPTYGTYILSGLVLCDTVGNR